MAHIAARIDGSKPFLALESCNQRMNAIILDILNLFVSFFGSLLAFIAWHHWDLEGFWRNRREKQRQKKGKNTKSD